jgi:ABC-type transporter Mla subunit MlaD
VGARRQGSLASNPLLIGAVTTLLIVVAVYLSFNANSGLPFVPTYNLKAALPNADGLIKGNDVRIGGTRVGIVASIVPYQDPRTGRTVAIVQMKLQKSVQPLPADTTTTVLSRSSVGLKYLELIRGSSILSLRPGSTIPASHYQEPVQIDEFFNMFDKQTRQASQENLNNGGNGFAGRGPNINETIHILRPLTANAIPVFHNLAAPKTGFGELWRALDRPAEQTAPVADANARFFVDLDIFFKAWASVARSLELAIEGGPPSLEQATFSLHHQLRFYENSAEFMRLLRPSAVALVQAAPPFARAVSAGIPNQLAAAELNERLEKFLGKLREFSEDPVVQVALEVFTRTAQLGNVVVAGIAPEQVTCNYVTLTLRNLASLLAQTISVGTVARAQAILGPVSPNSETGPASAAAAGPTPGFEPGSPGNYDFLHYNPYPNVAGPGQPAKLCEAGNEAFQPGQIVVGHTKVSATRTESTKRENNLFGEKYPPATLRALGISGGKGGK